MTVFAAFGLVLTSSTFGVVRKLMRRVFSLSPANTHPGSTDDARESNGSQRPASGGLSELPFNKTKSKRHVPNPDHC